jgi:hypothetical protein
MTNDEQDKIAERTSGHCNDLNLDLCGKSLEAHIRENVHPDYVEYATSVYLAKKELYKNPAFARAITLGLARAETKEGLSWDGKEKIDGLNHIHIRYGDLSFPCDFTNYPGIAFHKKIIISDEQLMKGIGDVFNDLKNVPSIKNLTLVPRRWDSYGYEDKNNYDSFLKYDTSFLSEVSEIDEFVGGLYSFYTKHNLKSWIKPFDEMERENLEYITKYNLERMKGGKK